MTPFTNPFRYFPHPLVRKAANEVMERLDKMIAEGRLPDAVAKGFADGKMLGVLICNCGSEQKILSAFSGSAGGTGIVEGFVPPIFDLTEDGGYYRTHEAEITEINKTVERLKNIELQPLTDSLIESNASRDQELEELRELKKKAAGIAESQFANGQIKRAKDRWKAVISETESRIQEVREKIAELKMQRARKSDELQKWIFSQYIVYNAEGGRSSILEVFQNQGIMPPGGTGDCAAPKLLNHAFRNGLKPVAMGEFWYGKSPSTAVRTHGHFYPSCTSKCGPLLGFMMKGLPVDGILDGKTKFLATPLDASHSQVHGQSWPFHPAPDRPAHTLNAGVIYEDEAIVIAEKPSGIPSVPGLDGRESLQEWLSKQYATEIHSVHRLDMDTSGIMIFARSRENAAVLMKQFEDHTVRKTYMARLSPADVNSIEGCRPVLHAGEKGRIELPLCPDYDERPRQKVDMVQGKPALTEYEIVSVNEDGTTDILFHPHTGRTHQLRVHSAHILGLGRPILGDMLYGGCGNAWSDTGSDSRLHLHACSITFRHPTSGEILTFSTPAN